MSGGTRVRVEPSSRITRSEAIIFSELDDAVVMMDAEAGSYYELDPVGARIWALAESRPRVAEVYEALVAEYEVPFETCVADVDAFLDKLMRLEVARVLRQGEAGENDHPDRGAAATARSSGEGTPVRRMVKIPKNKSAWTAPAIRAMAIQRTAASETSMNTIEAEAGDQYVGPAPGYSPDS